MFFGLFTGVYKIVNKVVLGDSFFRGQGYERNME
jgi:hypothetical protein